MARLTREQRSILRQAGYTFDNRTRQASSQRAIDLMTRNVARTGNAYSTSIRAKRDGSFTMNG